jgi:RNase P subunit RPR2
MKCKKCNNKFVKKENCVNRINGTKITVCPECGNEELYDKISSTEKVHKDKINDDFSKYMNPPEQ